MLGIARKRMSLSCKSTSLPVSTCKIPKHAGDDTDNRISDLPDSILCHILSFLPTKNSVAASLLSKRWKLLWTTVGNLDFCCPRSSAWDSTKEDEFVQFVNYVLLHHEHGNLDRFSLTWNHKCDSIYFNEWIDVAVTRNLLELVAQSHYSRFSIHDQTHLFTSERLQSLDLTGEICIPETVVSLPRLERLSLDLVRFHSEEAFHRLLLGCPVLKYLYVRLVCPIGFADGVGFKCIISSTSLKHLNLDDFYSKGGVELDAPSLEYIKLDKIRSIIIQQRLDLLREATIELVPNRCDAEYYNSFVEVLNAISCTKTLNLCGKAFECLSHASINMETGFSRLTRLEVKTCYWSSIQDLLELSDNLQVLIVNKGVFECLSVDGVDKSSWREPNVVPRCLSNSLKTVSINHFDTRPDKLAMVKYILKHGDILKTMQICFDGKCIDLFCRKRTNELIQVISSSPRKSTICEVRFKMIDI